MEVLEIVPPWMPTVKLSLNGEDRRDESTFVSDMGQRPDWQSWQAYLAQRPEPLSLDKLLSTSDTMPLLWCIDSVLDADDLALVQRLHDVGPRNGRASKRSKRKTVRTRGRGEAAAGSPHWNERVLSFLTRLGTTEMSAPLQYVSLAWAHALPRLARYVEDRLWWQLLETLVRQSAEARTGYRGSLVNTQLAGGELGITLAYVLPELPACFEPRNQARQLIVEAILETTDGEGMLHASHFDDLRVLLACWTRCAAIDGVLKKGRLGRDARVQLDWLLRQSLRFTRPDGTAVLSPASRSAAGYFGAAEAALSMTDDKEDRRIADCVLPVRKTRKVRALRTVGAEASEHSEWSELALLQSNWDPKTASVAVLYPQGQFRVELRRAARLLLSGPLEFSLAIDGTPVNSDVTWEETCWMSDQDVDYLELEAQLNDEWRIQRQFLLAHDDDFLYVADAILGESAARIEHTLHLPWGPQVSLRPEAEMTEILLQRGSNLAGRVLPLALPEWRSAAHAGGWAVDQGRFRLTATGKAIYMPLFFDLSRKRCAREVTWRQLTVAESLAIVAPDVAVGYRVQIGQEQWLFYRSLTPPASRTVLGQNLSTDFFAARFGADGEAEELLEIE